MNSFSTDESESRPLPPLGLPPSPFSLCPFRSRLMLGKWGDPASSYPYLQEAGARKGISDEKRPGKGEEKALSRPGRTREKVQMAKKSNCRRRVLPLLLSFFLPGVLKSGRKNEPLIPTITSYPTRHFNDLKGCPKCYVGFHLPNCRMPLRLFQSGPPQELRKWSFLLLLPAVLQKSERKEKNAFGLRFRLSSHLKRRAFPPLPKSLSYSRRLSLPNGFYPSSSAPALAFLPRHSVL